MRGVITYLCSFVHDPIAASHPTRQITSGLYYAIIYDRRAQLEAGVWRLAEPRRGARTLYVRRNAHLDSLLTASVMLPMVSLRPGSSFLGGGVPLLARDQLTDPVLLGLGKAYVVVALVTHGKDQEWETDCKFSDGFARCTLHSPKSRYSAHAPTTPNKAYPARPRPSSINSG